MENKTRELMYSSPDKLLTLKKYQFLIEEVMKPTGEDVIIFLNIKTSSQRVNLFNKIIDLTNTIELYKIDINEEILYIKLFGKKMLVKKDMQALKPVLIQFN